MPAMEVDVSNGLRTWMLATLGGWLVALVLVYLGERGLVPPPQAAAILPLSTDEQPLPGARYPRMDAPADGVLTAESAAAGASDEPSPSHPPRLVVADPVGANLRATPAMAGPVIAVLPRGTLVEPEPPSAPDEAVRPGWQHVVWNGRVGWVAESLLQPAAAP
jgi:hypothetical protein